MSGYQDAEINAGRFLNGGALLALIGRLACTVVLLAAGFAGLAFLFDAQSSGPNKLQVNDSVQLYMADRAVEMLRIGLCTGLLVEVLIYLVMRLGIPWRRVIWILPLAASLFGAVVAWRVLSLEELEIVPKIVMLMVGGGVVLFLAVSMHATLWQASFGVAPDVTDFPYVWYLFLVMMMSGFFGGFRGWTDTSPMIREVLDYRRSKWGNERPIETGKPAEETWIQ
jgi:hypothetical protein